MSARLLINPTRAQLISTAGRDLRFGTDGRWWVKLYDWEDLEDSPKARAYLERELRIKCRRRIRDSVTELVLLTRCPEHMSPEGRVD